MALMTKVNNPKVMIVKGNPKRLRIGFTIKFRIPKTIAKMIAPPNPVKCTPGRIHVKRYATTAVIRSRIIKFILLIFLMFMRVGVQKVFHLLIGIII